MKKWQTFFRMSSSERWLAFQAFLLLLITVVILPLVGFRRWQTILKKFLPQNNSAGNKENFFERSVTTGRMVQIASNQLPCRTTCLHRSVVLWWLLTRQSIDCDLQIGVRKESGELLAHAWIECFGVRLGEHPETNQFQTLLSRNERPVFSITE